MKKGSTLLLRGIIFLLGTLVLLLCVFVLPNGIRTTEWDGYRPILLTMYVPAVPFFIALFHALKLLHLIDHNKAFSKKALRSLKYIKYSAFSIGAVYGVLLPYVYVTAQKDDAPGVLMLGLVFTCAPLAITVLTTLLQNVFQNAMKIKSVNDKTI